MRVVLPRLSPGEGVSGAAANLAAVVLFGLLGAALLHLAAFHLRAGSVGAYLLAHCPWRPISLAILLVTLCAGLLFWRGVRTLVRERMRLGRHLRVTVGAPALRRKPARLAGFFVVVYLIELVATALATRLAPMEAPMVMGGHRMLMAIGPAFPLWLGQLVMAGVLALVLWRLERRATVLRAHVSLLRRLTILLRMPMASRPRMWGTIGRTPRTLFGYAIFSRPPPAWGILA